MGAFAFSALLSPRGLAYDRHHRVLWILDRGYDSIWTLEVNQTDYTLTSIEDAINRGPVPDAANSASSLVYDPTHRVLFLGDDSDYLFYAPVPLDYWRLRPGRFHTDWRISRHAGQPAGHGFHPAACPDSTSQSEYHEPWCGNVSESYQSLTGCPDRYQSRCCCHNSCHRFFTGSPGGPGPLPVRAQTSISA